MCKAGPKVQERCVPIGYGAAPLDERRRVSACANEPRPAPPEVPRMLPAAARAKLQQLRSRSAQLSKELLQAHDADSEAARADYVSGVEASERAEELDCMAAQMPCCTPEQAHKRDVLASLSATWRARAIWCYTLYSCSMRRIRLERKIEKLRVALASVDRRDDEHDAMQCYSRAKREYAQRLAAYRLGFGYDGGAAAPCRPALHA